MFKLLTYSMKYICKKIQLYYCYYREMENNFNICSCSLFIHTVLNCAFFTLYAAIITWNLFIQFYTTVSYILTN